jgi:hypothetical protein
MTAIGFCVLSSPWRARVAFLALVLAALFAQTGGQAQSPNSSKAGVAALSSDALTYSRGFLITGNYVIGGVDLPRGGGTGAITFSSANGNAVPPNAEVVAAYLYWEALAPFGAPVGQALFRGAPIALAKASRLLSPPGSGANCWGSSGSTDRALTMWRADVLPLLPKQYDANDKWTGRYLVNDIPHQVTIGTPGGGNTLSTTAGATLMLVYRDPTEPLRKIVVYDGVHAQAQGTTTSQTIRGFYQSAATRSAKITHIVGSGANNAGERLLFNGSVVATNPFPAPIDGSADRGWANPTYDVSSLMPGTDFADGFGETATTSVDHGATNQHATPYECLSWAAIIFSTAVADTDSDGLPDGVENAAGGLKDPPTPAFPEGQPLPDLHGMGARVGPRNLFVEINAMWARANTTYGSADAPYNATRDFVTDANGHHHMPSPDVLKRVGDAYSDGGITPHFDVGDTDAYYALFCPDGGQCKADAVTAVGAYLVPSHLARGGELIEERACSTCQFKDYPGTVGWPYGFQLYRDAPVDDDGAELTNLEIRQRWGAGERRRRFDPVRQDFFRYAMYAHARGSAKSPLPCLDEDGEPIAYSNASTRACATGPNPMFHVPSSASGVAQLPGGNALISLGLWDTEHFVGSSFIQASTTLHELGHTLNLWHGGKPAVFGNKAQNTTTFVEPNCKPNYMSSMSYLFQIHGLFDAGGIPRIDYSGAPPDPLDETSLTDGTQFLRKYRPVWFAPVTSPLAINRGSTAARRFCNGAPLPPGTEPWMARVQAAHVDEAIDWDGQPSTSGGERDVNFDGTLSTVLQGHDDWQQLRLDQIGGSRRAQIISRAPEEPALDFASGDLLDFASGDLLDFASGDLIDFASGTHLVHMNSGDFLRYGQGDLLDFASGDLLDFASGDLLNIGSGILMFTGSVAGSANNGDLIDFASGDLIDFASGDLIDFASGDLIDFASGDLIDFASGDLIDFASGDLLDFASGAGLQELTFEMAIDMERPRPFAVVACMLGEDCPDASQPAPGNENFHRVKLTWEAPTFGEVAYYQIYRHYTTDATPDFGAVVFEDYTYVGRTPDASRVFIDTEELPDGVKFAYSVRARLTDDTLSPYSDRALHAPTGQDFITAINAPPVAADDSFITDQGTTIIVNAPGVLANDLTDIDSPPASRRVRGVTTSPLNGQLVVHGNGSFTYTPNPGFSGTDTFSYEADNGIWGATNLALSGASNAATVTITVNAAPSVTYGFVNVQNLPPPAGTQFNRGSTVPLRWQWTNAAGVAVNTSGDGVSVVAYACSSGSALGSFTPQSPGSGNSFAFDAATNTWQFNWKLVNATGQNLPKGTYLVQVRNAATGQTDPNTPQASCSQLAGAVITVK